MVRAARLVTGIILGFAAVSGVALTARAQEAGVTGLLFLDSNTPNHGVVTQIQYDGPCPGAENSLSHGRFIDSKVAPAHGRRVIVKNVSAGVGNNPYPYTDREYEKEGGSQEFKIFVDAHHDNEGLAMIEGENQLSYQVKEGSNVLDEGTFTTTVRIEPRTGYRHPLLSHRPVCTQKTESGQCLAVRNQVTKSCPDGSIVNRYLVGPTILLDS